MIIIQSIRIERLTKIQALNFCILIPNHVSFTQRMVGGAMHMLEHEVKRAWMPEILNEWSCFMSIETTLLPSEPALLALADGSVFQGTSIGYSGDTVGEVVFNTAMTGYQEILTDPSYTQQIVTLTYPHIGNTGINPEDFESNRAHLAGFIIRECSPIVSNWRATQSLPDFLKAQKIVAIANIDTRRLTHILREKGAQNGCILTGKNDVALALQKARAFAGLSGKDLTMAVSCTRIRDQESEINDLHLPIADNRSPVTFYHIIIYDFGLKLNIIRQLQNRNCKVTVVPAKTSVDDVLKLNPDGILLSNGPGDPAACIDVIKNIQALLAIKIPLFGICLGFQLLALAYGAKTKKMKFGHHGANHPVQDIKSKKVLITSQNHGFCVDEKTLPSELEVTHISLFDKTVQGFKHTTLPVMAFQGHPEAGPGPGDVSELFDRFVQAIKDRRSVLETPAKN